MTSLQKQILEAVRVGKESTGLPQTAHVKYLPEVLALVNTGKLKLIESSSTKLVVDIP